MNNQNDRLIRATVLGGSLLALIAVGWPLVDEYRGLRADHRELTQLETELRTASQRDERLRRVEARIAVLKSKTLDRTITREKIEGVRDQVLLDVRQSGATLRSLDIQEGQNRRWGNHGDDPKSRRSPDIDEESELNLNSHSLFLSAEGGLDAILTLTERLTNHGWLLTVDSVDLTPTASDRTVIGLELRLTLYGLSLDIGTLHGQGGLANDSHGRDLPSTTYLCVSDCVDTRHRIGAFYPSRQWSNASID